MSLTLIASLFLAAQDPSPPPGPAPPPAAPVEAAPVEAAPVEAAPVEAPPVEAAPAPVDVVPAAVAPVEKRGAVVVTAAPGKGLTVKSDDDRYSLTLRTRAQLRDTATFTQETVGAAQVTKAQNEANIKTLRLIAQGNVLVKDLKYSIQLAFGPGDFESGSATPIFDAFVEYTGLRDANVRVGQFFVPFDRARTIREFALQFTDRQQVVRELTLDRDVGVSVSSNDLLGLDGWLGYALFVGVGEGRNQLGGRNPGPLVVARLATRPFGNFDDDQEADLTRSPKPRLAVGVAGAYNSAASRVSSTFGPSFVGGTADYAHAAADVVFKLAGFSLLTEGVVRQGLQSEVSGLDDEGKTVVTPTRSGTGYFVQAGYLFTDWFEVVGRWDDLYAHEGTDPAFVKLANTAGRQVGGGVNLYLNGHAFKLQVDAFHIFGNDDGPGKQIARAQIDASF